MRSKHLRIVLNGGNVKHVFSVFWRCNATSAKRVVRELPLYRPERTEESKNDISTSMTAIAMAKKAKEERKRTKKRRKMCNHHQHLESGLRHSGIETIEQCNIVVNKSTHHTAMAAKTTRETKIGNDKISHQIQIHCEFMNSKSPFVSVPPFLLRCTRYATTKNSTMSSTIFPQFSHSHDSSKFEDNQTKSSTLSQLHSHNDAACTR